jgi:hypothetical protein
MIGAFEQNVLPKQVDEGAPQSESLGFLDILEQCSYRQIVKDGKCENCPTFHKPSDDRKSCYMPKCAADEVCATCGNCVKCPEGQKPSDD